jgi:carbon storage regulator
MEPSQGGSTMLVLSRRIGEQLVIGDQVTVTINRVSGNRVSLGIEAPPHVRVVRSELRDALLAVLHAEDNPSPDHGSSGRDACDSQSGDETTEIPLGPLTCR